MKQQRTTIDDVEHLRAWVQAASDLVRSVNAERPVATLLTTVADQARALLGLDRCGVFIANEARSELVIQGSSGLSGRYLERLHAEHPLLVETTGGGSVSPSALAFLGGRTVAIADINLSAEMGPWRKLALQEGYEALIATPLREGDKTVGVIVGYGHEPRAFPQAQIDMLEMFAVHAGTALQAAHLRDASREMIDMLNSANSKLRQQRHRLEVIDQQHRRLMQVMANDVGLNGVVTMLAELLEGSVTLEDVHGGSLASAARGAYVAPPQGDERARDEVQAAIADVISMKAGCIKVVSSKKASHSFWVAPVAVDKDVVAILWVGGPSLVIDDLGRVAIERFAMALALELLKQRNAAQVRLRLSRDLVADLLSPFKQAERVMLFERAEAMGHDLHLPHRLLLARPDGKRLGSVPGQGLLEVADVIVRKHAPGSVVGGANRDVVILLQQPSAHTGSQLAKLLLAEFRRRNPGRTASVVVGAIGHDLSDYAAHYRSARGASRLAENRRDTIIDIGDLGVASLLLSHGDHRALEAFAHQTLGPVIEHDEKRGTDLALTLRYWLENDCRTAQTAQQLIVHANTVNYRLKVVEELLGRSLRSPAFLVEVDIALMVLDVLGATATQ